MGTGCSVKDLPVSPCCTGKEGDLPGHASPYDLTSAPRKVIDDEILVDLGPADLQTPEKPRICLGPPAFASPDRGKDPQFVDTAARAPPERIRPPEPVVLVLDSIGVIPAGPSTTVDICDAVPSAASTTRVPPQKQQLATTVPVQPPPQEIAEAFQQRSTTSPLPFPAQKLLLPTPLPEQAPLQAVAVAPSDARPRSALSKVQDAFRRTSDAQTEIDSYAHGSDWKPEPAVRHEPVAANSEVAVGAA